MTNLPGGLAKANVLAGEIGNVLDPQGQHRIGRDRGMHQRVVEQRDIDSIAAAPYPCELLVIVAECGDPDLDAMALLEGLDEARGDGPRKRAIECFKVEITANFPGAHDRRSRRRLLAAFAGFTLLGQCH